MFFFFFFQAEDGIRDVAVTGVQTCALPICAILHIFDPGNTTFVKHFICQASTMTHNNQCISDRVAGYINTTSAVVGIKFECESGASFDGIFTLYGVS